MAEEHFFSTLATVHVSQDGEVYQGFDKLEQLNSFKMRKTFWDDESDTCHGKVCLYPGLGQGCQLINSMLLVNDGTMSHRPRRPCEISKILKERRYP